MLPDINEWLLEYADQSIEFGLLSSEYPFRVQVDISEASRTTQDSKHPTSDGRLMGKDLLDGLSLGFDVLIVPEYPPTDDAWNPSLNKYTAFAAKWRADAIRRIPGEYATLANISRNRMVYGRPRKIGQKLARLRKGEVNFVATFETLDANFYNYDESVALIAPVPPPVGGFFTPIVFPWSTADSSNETVDMTNDGDVETWPIINITGPGSHHVVELYDGGDQLWVIKVPNGLAYDEIMTIDTRPWHRSVTVNGEPGNGRIRGSRLEDCKLPVGEFLARFTVNDISGTSSATLRWRDAFASL